MIGSPSLATSPSIKISGSTTVNPVVSEAAEYFQKRGWRVLVDTQGGSSGGISQVAEGNVNIGMSSRPLVEQDSAKFPKAKLVSHTIGYDGVALVVSRQLANDGVRSLSKAQVRDIYEGKIKNWKDVGGPDRRIVFFNKEPGRGTWEVFAAYIYEKTAMAPKVFHPEVGANEEARSKVSSHRGAITQLSASWAWESATVQAIALQSADGKLIEANRQNIESGEYPMRRPLLLITNGEATGAVIEFIQFIQSPAGQKIVEKHGYLPIKTTAS